MNEFHKLLNVTEDEYDNCETNKAPSGEWDEYNIHYLEVQARWYGMEELANSVGTCAKCAYFDAGMKDYCRRLNITCSPDWYCADFHRVADTKRG